MGGVPCVEDPLEDRQGDGRQEDGGASLDEVERDGGVHVHAAAAARGGHVQELRGPVAHRLPGRERRRDAWQDRVGGAEGRGRQEVESCGRVQVGIAWLSTAGTVRTLIQNYKP